MHCRENTGRARQREKKQEEITLNLSCHEWRPYDTLKQDRIIALLILPFQQVPATSTKSKTLNRINVPNLTHPSSTTVVQYDTRAPGGYGTRRTLPNTVVQCVTIFLFLLQIIYPWSRFWYLLQVLHAKRGRISWKI